MLFNAGGGLERENCRNGNFNTQGRIPTAATPCKVLCTEWCAMCAMGVMLFMLFRMLFRMLLCILEVVEGDFRLLDMLE